MKPRQVLQLVFILNALVSIAAAILLFVSPAAIPAVIGISLQSDQYFLPRLLGAAEFAVAAACLMAVYQPSRATYSLCVAMLIVFHAGSIMAGVMESMAHSNMTIAINKGVRSVMIVLLLVFHVLGHRSG